MTKHVDLRKTPSLELGMMFIFAYVPYGLAESLKLSGFLQLLEISEKINKKQTKCRVATTIK